MKRIRLFALIMVAAIFLGTIAGCGPANEPQDTETTEHTTTEKVTQTANPEDEATKIPETTESFTIEETTVTETVSEETTSGNVEHSGSIIGVWRLEKVIAGSLVSEQVKPVEYDLSEEMISVSISDESLYMGKTDNIKEQYSYLGSVSVEIDENAEQNVTISLFSFATGRSLTATYLAGFTTDQLGNRKMILVLKELEGDATRFGFESFMNQEHTLVMAEWGYAEADSEHDTGLFRSNDTVWYAEQPSLGRYKKLRFSYDEGFNVYDNNLIVGTWRTITRGKDKILIITDTDGYVTEGTYSVNSSEHNPILVIKWDDEEPESRYFVPTLEFIDICY